MVSRYTYWILKSITVVLIFVLSLTPSHSATAAPPQLFEGFWESVEDSFTGTSLLFHGVGIATTPLLVSSGFDAQVRDTFRYRYNEAAVPGAILGSGLGALVAGVWLYNSDDMESVGAAYTIAQASLITVTYVLALKLTTGRAHPTNNWPLSSQEQAEQWQLGFMRNGMTVYGWPSGHVSHTVAVTSALAHYYPDKNWLKWMGAGLSAYMVYTISAYNSGQMHWFSDGVAGAFMGYAIGSSVGKNMRSLVDGTPPRESDGPTKVSWIPLAGSRYLGATAVISF